jgi:hypothetical protein
MTIREKALCTAPRGKAPSVKAAHAIAAGGRDCHLAVEHKQPRALALVNLVVGEALTGCQIEHDRARRWKRGFLVIEA